MLCLRSLSVACFVCPRSVFVHRYRDQNAVVRALSLQMLGKWILAFPEHFLSDQYLKYIGWCLSDKVS